MDTLHDGFGFQWHITDRCPGRCRHCYQRNFDGSAELPIDALKRIADTIMRTVAVPVSVNITGGEPLYYQYNADTTAQQLPVFDLIKHLSAFPNIDEINIITGAYGVTNEVLYELASLTHLTHIKVSLESHEEHVNDSIRGNGHFKMATRSIQAMAQAGLSVIIMATLGKYNAAAVSGLCAYAARLGARGIIFERYVPLGNGLALSDAVLTAYQWKEVAAAVCHAASLDIPPEELMPYRAFRLDFPHSTSGVHDGDYALSGALCNLGESSMALMPDGTVFPCRRFPKPIGTLPHDSMERIMDSLKSYSQHPQQCYAFDF